MGSPELRGRGPDSPLSCLSPQQEAQKIFKANHPMDPEVTKAKVRNRSEASQPALLRLRDVGSSGCSVSLNLSLSLL